MSNYNIQIQYPGVAGPIGGAIPAGTNGQMQFNDSGVLGGASMTYNSTNKTYNVPAPSTAFGGAVETITQPPFSGIYPITDAALSLLPDSVSGFSQQLIASDNYTFGISVSDSSTWYSGFSINDWNTSNTFLLYSGDSSQSLYGLFLGDGVTAIELFDGTGIYTSNTTGGAKGQGTINATGYYVNGLVSLDAEAQSSSCSFHINDVPNNANFFGYNHGLFTNIGAYPTLSFNTGSDPTMTTTTMSLTNGLSMTGATGGDQGVGTINATGYYVNGVPVATGVLTVATLPTAAAGARAFVSDSTVAAAGNFGAIIAGGSTHTVPVWSDGTHWYIG